MLFFFNCDWVDNRVRGKWVKTYQFGVTTINFKHLFSIHEIVLDEPFILAWQVVQVFYVHDQIDTDWIDMFFSQNQETYRTWIIWKVGT